MTEAIIGALSLTAPISPLFVCVGKRHAPTPTPGLEAEDAPDPDRNGGGSAARVNDFRGSAGRAHPPLLSIWPQIVTGNRLRVTVTQQTLSAVRVRTRATLAKPEIAQLVLRGARACGFPVPGAILAELLKNPEDESTGIFVGATLAGPRVVTVGFLPLSAFWLAPIVALAYAEHAPPRLVRLVGKTLRGWFREAGADHVVVANLLHTDRAFIRGLGHFGRPSVSGSMIRFEFGDA